ncbi:MAG: spondin domain-containing protein [Chitinophagaceae bacterium]
MKPLIIFLSGILLFVSCSKDKDNQPLYAEARYTVTITGKWSAPAFTVPGGAHYTTFAGMIHNSNASLWKEGTMASHGTEFMAETGNVSGLLNEVDSMIADRSAVSLLLFYGPTVTGSRATNFSCSNNYPLVSFGAMLGPTPDWFVGVSNISLYNNGWVSDTTINLYALDAGTEEGNVFAYNNPPTVPLQNIHILQATEATVLANGNPVLAPIATARFRKQD